MRRGRAALAVGEGRSWDKVECRSRGSTGGQTGPWLVMQSMLKVQKIR